MAGTVSRDYCSPFAEATLRPQNASRLNRMGHGTTEKKASRGRLPKDYPTLEKYLLTTMVVPGKCDTGSSNSSNGRLLSTVG